MDDREKTKEQLLHELTALRQRVALQEEAIRRGRSAEALTTHTRQMEVVRAVTIEITRELHLSPLLKLIIQRAVELVGAAAAGTIHLWDEAEQVLITRAWHGIRDWVGEVRLRTGEGVLGTVAQRRQGLIVDNYQRSPYADPLWAERLGPIAIMVEPLLYRERFIGVITVSHKQSRASFTAEDQNFLTLFAAQAAIAIENARLFEENTRHQTWLTSILDINKRIVASKDMGSLLRRIAEEAIRLVGADGARVRLRQGNRLVVLAEVGASVAMAWSADVGLGEGRAGQGVREKRAMVVPDIQADPDILSPYKVHAAQNGVHSLVSVPITGRHDVIGVLNVMSKRPRRFTAEEVTALSACAEQAAIAIEQTRLIEAGREQMARLEQTNTSLRNSEARKGAILESAVDGIVTIDQEGKIIEFNPAAEKLLGYPRSAAVGQLMADLIIPPSLRERPHRGLTHYLATGAGSVLGKRVEMLALRRDGTAFPIEISIARVGAEEPALFTGFLYDITERKRAEQAEREYIKRLRGMYEIAQAILLARSPEEIAKNTLHHLRQLVPCNLAGVALLDFTARETMVLAVDSDGKTRRLQSGGRQPLEMYDGLNVLRQDRVYMVEDVFTCSLPLSVLQRRLAQGVRAYLRVPLTAEGTLLGSLTLRWNSPRAFTPEQVAIAREVASQLAVALQQARLHVAAQRRLQELTAIAQVSDNLRQLHPPDILTSQLLGILEQLLGYDYGAILLLDDATGQLMPFAFNAQKQGKTLGEADQASVLSRQPGLGVEITGWVAHTGKSVCVGDIRQDPRYYAMHDNMRSALCVPLRLGDRVIGVINVESTRPDAYTEADQRVLETVAGQVAIALRNAQLFEQLRSTNARLQSLSHQLVETREAERHAVARELHDDIGQALTAVHINLQTLKNMPAAAWASRLEDSIGILDDTLCRVRNLALSLRPALLDELGLVPALRWYVDQQAQRAKFTVRFVAGSLPRRLPHNIEIACFRIVQEALTNVMRHAQARQVHIALHQRAAALHLVIRDDGNGFDVDAAQQHAAHGRSMGLLNMRERALLAGGQFAITSAPRRGTKIRVQFPV